MIGVKPGQVHLGHIFEVMHPDDLNRFGLLKAQAFIMEMRVRESQKESELVSFTIRMRNPSGEYSNYICQAYFFFSAIPCKTVYLLQIITRIDWFRMKNKDYLDMPTKLTTPCRSNLQHFCRYV